MLNATAQKERELNKDELRDRLAKLEAENARLRAHIIKSDDFVERNCEFPLSCIYEAAELLDERRALLEPK